MTIPPSAIIPREQHPISKTEISEPALQVLNGLHKHRFAALLVGGGVRDLLLRHTPKDFDIATDATPNQVKKIFRHCRLIGRRFRLAHVVFGRQIIEVATFRSGKKTRYNKHHAVSDEGLVIRDNVYGTIKEDAWRRDFTVNALYYNIADFSIIDFTGGFEDLQQKILRIIGDPQKRYQEDPVRMLRAVRFAAKLGFTLHEATEAPLLSMAEQLSLIAPARLFDEVLKIYHSGQAQTAQALLIKYHLFQQLFPLTNTLLVKQGKNSPTDQLIQHTLANTDQRIRNEKPVTPAFLYAAFLWHPMLALAEQYQQEGTQPLLALQKAMQEILRQQNQHTVVPKRLTNVIKEIWWLQYRLPRRYGKRAFRLLATPRFRAGYDFLLLRATIGEAPEELAEWWTKFQQSDAATQQTMVAAVIKKSND